MNIVEDHTLTEVEADLERPLLPFNTVPLLGELANFEGSTFWLNDVQRLEVCTESLCFWNVLIGWLDLVFCWLLNSVVLSCREVVDTSDLHGSSVNDWGDVDWHSIMVTIKLAGVVWVANVEEALERTLFVREKSLIDTIRS